LTADIPQVAQGRAKLAKLSECASGTVTGHSSIERATCPVLPVRAQPADRDKIARKPLPHSPRCDGIECSHVALSLRDMLEGEHILGGNRAERFKTLNNGLAQDLDEENLRSLNTLIWAPVLGFLRILPKLGIAQCWCSACLCNDQATSSP
jgi:hypothetical protein